MFPDVTSPRGKVYVLLDLPRGETAMCQDWGMVGERGEQDSLGRTFSFSVGMSDVSVLARALPGLK